MRIGVPYIWKPEAADVAHMNSERIRGSARLYVAEAITLDDALAHLQRSYRRSGATAAQTDHASNLFREEYAR
jgi:hypothetical protein